ncbi:MFS transporter [Sporichthya polymorpha]|uniref:MFS transporter n=1 Tax=Sporichthya polymorpha TaxID=35751 RepID=UPI00037144EF|nr:MFS transporter [Sporichthya polymorpha]
MSSVADLRHVLRHGDFRKLFATRLASQAADGMFQVALASFVFFSPERAGTASSAAATFTVLLLPYTLVGPFAGVFLDRWRRRQVLVGASAARAVVVTGVALIAWQDNTGPVLYVTALVALSINRFYLAALSASMPHVVDRDELIMANSVSVTAGSIAAMLGGGVGLGVGALAGEEHGDPVTMLVTAATYLAASGLATRMGRDLLGPDLADEPPAVREAVRHVAAGLVDGTRHIWHQPPARNALAATTALRFCYALAALAAILLYRNHFNDPGGDGDEAMAELAVVFGAGAVGYFLAAVLTPPVSARIGKPALIVWALVTAGVLGFACGVPYTPALVVAGSFVLGVTTQTVKICVDTIVQESIADAYRGRVFAVYDTVFNLAFLAAAGLGALAMPDSGKSYPLLVGVSIGYLVTAVLYGRSLPRRERTRPEREERNENPMTGSSVSEAATEDPART